MIASIILALYLLNVLPPESAAAILYTAGILLIIGELFATTFGVMALNGVLALAVAYLIRSGIQPFGLETGWGVFFGIALLELIAIVTTIALLLRFRGIQPTTGTESMVGKTGQVVDWKDKKGHVRIEGEVWQAYSDQKMELKKYDEVTINQINKLKLKITN